MIALFKCLFQAQILCRFQRTKCRFWMSNGNYHNFNPRQRKSISQSFVSWWYQQIASCNESTLAKSLNDLHVVPRLNVNELKTDQNGKLYLNAKRLGSLETSQLEDIKSRFNLKGLTSDNLDRYNVCISSDGKRLFFPFYTMDGNIGFVQIFFHEFNEELKEIKCPENRTETAFFGWPIAMHTKGTVILTSNCIDAVVLHQTTNAPAITHYFESENFSPKVFHFLKQFKKIVMWFDSRLHNWILHKFIVENLVQQCFFVRPSNCFYTATQCFQDGIDLKPLVDEAHPLKHKSIETFSKYEMETFKEFSDHKNCSGVKWKRFPVLNELLKGHRRGELTILSGQTGTGKTTFVSEYSLDLCMQGVPTLWGSFEIKNARLLKTMMTQFSLCSLVDCPEKFNHWAAEFNKLPFFLMTFNGHYSIRNVLEAMHHALVVYNIEHVVIDNLQFMMNVDDSNATIDQLRRQDQLFAAFRQFATQCNCHITLVIHPRKEPEFSELNNMSISGSAKAVQEADNVLILQTTKMKQYLQVSKNRFDGTKGCVLLDFNKKTLTFSSRKVASKPVVHVNDD